MTVATSGTGTPEIITVFDQDSCYSGVSLLWVALWTIVCLLLFPPFDHWIVWQNIMAKPLRSSNETLSWIKKKTRHFQKFCIYISCIKPHNNFKIQLSPIKFWSKWSLHIILQPQILFVPFHQCFCKCSTQTRTL